MKQICLLLLFLFVSPWVLSEPPPAHEVFQLTTKPLDPNTFSLNWQIKKGFFLYKNRIHLISSDQSIFQLGAIQLPKGIKKTNAQNKSYSIYKNQLNLSIPVIGEHPGEALLNLHYQGCSEDGFCYPPEDIVLKLSFNNELALMNVTTEPPNNLPKAPAPSPEETDELSQLFSTHNTLLIILSFFGFGLLLSFTPCVLPMVPVLSGIIVGHGHHISTHKAFFLSLSYVLSMSITYAAIGALIALLGNNLQITMQSPWIIGLFSLVFVLLALSMFNFYELKLPVSWQSKLATVTRSQHGGHYLGSALMGCLSTLILSPCVTAPLIGALGYIAQSGDITLGVLSLFFLGLGMGTPLLLIGTSAGKWLPKAGHWMNGVKSFFGVLLLAVAIHLLQRILPGALIMGLWAALLIFCGLFLGALTRANSNQDRFLQGLGILCLIYGLLILIGASKGNTNPLQPLISKPVTGHSSTEESRIVVKTMGEMQQALANTQGKPILIDFYADWCESCKVIENTTLQDPEVALLLKDFVVLKVDITDNNNDSKTLLHQFNVIAPPTFLFLDREGKELNHLRLVGELSTNTFFDHLSKTLTSRVGQSSP